MGMGGYGMGGYGGGGGGMGGFGGGGFGMGGFGGGGYGMGGFGMGGYGMGGYGMGGYGMGGYGMSPAAPASGGAGGGTGGSGSSGGSGGTDQTGQYMGSASIPGMFGFGMRGPRIIPNPMDNTLLIQATPQEYEAVVKMLKDLDVPPRQVLIEAKIYEVSLGGAFSNGVAAFLESKSSTAQKGLWRNLGATMNQGNLALSSSLLVGQSKQLLLFLSSAEAEKRTRVISSPSIIATDSISASISVGVDVPVLTSQGVTGAQSGGTSIFANTISNRSTGVQLSITARVNPTGIVTLLIGQDVSAPQASSGGISSPSFSRRSVNTQVTVQDGDTIAIGGIIAEESAWDSSGVPLLHRLPFVGAAFGSKSSTKARSELVIFMTPRVIYDTNEILEASEELKANLRKLQKLVKE
jgi:general secretion pathway protein D